MPRERCINCKYMHPEKTVEIITCWKRESEAFLGIVNPNDSCEFFDPETLVDGEEYGEAA